MGFAELSALLQLLPQPACIADSRGVLRFLNEAARSIVDVPLPQPAQAVADPASADHFWLAVPGGMSPNDGARQLDFNAGDAVFHARWIAMPNSPSEADGDDVLFVSVRVTEQRTTAVADQSSFGSAETIYRAILDALPDYVFAKNLDSEFIFANQETARRMKAASPEDLIGKTDHDFYPADLADGYLADERTFFERGHTVLIEQPIPRDDGTRGAMVSLKKPLLDREGEICGYIGHGRDISEQRRAEAEAAGRRALAVSLEEALKAEQQTSAQQREFIRMVSHEFRTPLAIIDGAAGSVERKLGRMSNDRIAERIADVRGAVKRMLRLLESTMSATRLVEGAITMSAEDFDLRGLIGKVCQDQAQLAPERKIDIEVDDLPEKVSGDPGLMYQILSNLVANAHQYSPAVCPVTVAGRCDDAHAMIQVRDCGPGIPEDERDKVFEQFFRGSTSTGKPGTGVGLYLAKAFVEMHRGEITFTSSIGEGTAFDIRLPLREAG